MSQGSALQSFSKSLRGKIILLAVGLTLATALLASVMHLWKTQEIAESMAVESLAGEARLTAEALNTQYKLISRDLSFLLATPPITGIQRAIRNGGFDTADNSDLEQWNTRLQAIFVSMMKERRYYDQIRYINAKNGREMVRVNQTAEGTEIVSAEELQDKSGEPYFHEGTQLSPRQVYYSDITHNREHGKVDKTLRPVLRVIMPVFDKTGDMFGMLVINASYDLMMKEILDTARFNGDVLVVSHDGHYMGRKANGKIIELRMNAFREDHAELHEQIMKVGGEGIISEGDDAGYFVRVPYAYDVTGRVLTLILLLPMDTVFAEVAALIQQSLIVAVFMAALALVLAVWVGRRMTQPLKEMTAAISNYREGETLQLPIGQNDEVGKLARAFDELVDNLQQSRSDQYESDERLKAVIETTVDGIITIDKKGSILSFNPACERIFGYDKEEVIGQNVKMLMPEPYHGEHDGYLDNYRETGVRKIIGIGREVEAKRKDGSIFPIELGVSEVQLSDGQFFSGIIRDISDRKAMENQLSDTRKFQQLILETNPDLVFVKDQNYRIIEANPAFLALYPDKSEDEVLGYTGLESHDPDEAEAFNAMDKKAFEEGSCETLETIHFPTGKKTLFTQKIRFENEQGEPFILGIARDVTEREALLERLTKSNEWLERFAFVCSHDLQEPLRMIRSFSDKLEGHMGEVVRGDEKAQRYLNYVTDGAKRAQDLISGILAYSSVDNDMDRMEEIDLNDMLSSIQENFQSALEQNKGSISYDALPSLRCNKTQIFQLFSNLINNGMKYQQPDAMPHVHIGVADEGMLWHFTIQDNGIGMDEKHFKKIFDVFQRLHGKQDYAGSGMGLAICKKIVERHGGKIWVESELGKGSIFHFTLERLEMEQSDERKAS